MFFNYHTGTILKTGWKTSLKIIPLFGCSWCSDAQINNPLLSWFCGLPEQTSKVQRGCFLVITNFSTCLWWLRLVKAMVFPVVMYGCESWTITRAECRRIDAFELWCWRRLLRVPWTARRSNQSILKETSPGCSLEGLMLKLKLQYFGHLMRRADSFEKTLMLGKIEGRRRTGWQRMRWLDGITDSMDMGLGGLQELLMDRDPMNLLWFIGSQRVGHNWATELNWTGGSAGKESAYSAGDLGSICGLGRSLGGRRGNPLQYACLPGKSHGQRSLAD